MTYVIRGTHRAYMDSDSPQTAWVRDEAGKLDMSEVEALTVEIKSEGRELPRLTLDATSPEAGQLSFTVPANSPRLWPGTFSLFAKADGEVVYTGLLEVLA